MYPLSIRHLDHYCELWRFQRRWLGFGGGYSKWLGHVTWVGGDSGGVLFEGNRAGGGGGDIWDTNRRPF